ncbi:hypothetical protein D3C87_1498810 [compost metagenome]
MPALVIEVADDKPALAGFRDRRGGRDGVFPGPFAGSDHLRRRLCTCGLDEIIVDEDRKGRGRERIGEELSVLRPAFRGPGADFVEIVTLRGLQRVGERIERA